MKTPILVVTMIMTIMTIPIMLRLILAATTLIQGGLTTTLTTTLRMSTPTLVASTPTLVASRPILVVHRAAALTRKTTLLAHRVKVSMTTAIAAAHTAAVLTLKRTQAELTLTLVAHLPLAAAKSP